MSTLSLKDPWDAGESQTSELHSGNATRGGNFGVQVGGICRAEVSVCAEKMARSCLFGYAESLSGAAVVFALSSRVG